LYNQLNLTKASFQVIDIINQMIEYIGDLLAQDKADPETHNFSDQKNYVL